MLEVEIETSVNPDSTLCGGVAANQRADTGAIGRRHAAQIDHDVFVAGLEHVLDAPLELFGRTSGDQRFLRGQEQPIRFAAFDRKSRHWGRRDGTVTRMVKLGKG